MGRLRAARDAGLRNRALRRLPGRLAGLLLGVVLLGAVAAPVPLVAQDSPSGGAAGGAPAPALQSPDWAAMTGFPSPPELTARSAILVEAGSRTVLYARNPHLVIPPASLTKVVAIDVALAAAAQGEVRLDRRFSPPSESWAENQPPDSSLMFLGPGQELTMRELLAGLAISSGNDAAVALAVLLDGGVPAFARRMNARSRDLGLTDLYFVEPSGLSPQNTITAHAFARFLLAHIQRFPWTLEALYNRTSYTYPDEQNRTSGSARSPITQSNRNTLVGTLEGVDGIKTGFIEESGYHLAATAERNGRRLVAIILGIDAESHARGGAIRAAEAEALLEYGFRAFTELELGYPAPRAVTVYRGRAGDAVPVGPPNLRVSVPRGAEERIEGRLDQIDEVLAPTPRAIVGEVSIVLDGVTLAAESLVLPAQEEAGLLGRLWDGARLAFRRLLGRENARDLPVPASELVPAAR